MKVDWVSIEIVLNGFIVRCGNNERNIDGEASGVFIFHNLEEAIHQTRILLEEGI